MCGITGFTGSVIDRDKVIRNMTDVITHRGPDSSGVYQDDEISMGFRRLSIIDISQTGDQPIYNEDKSLVLTFNGEIYNYQDLRKELLEKGHVFTTKTDSEVLLHGFEEWHEGLLNRLRGMFGFAIYNKKDKSLFMARDFFGIKPLHYTMVGDHFVYGSEIKSILQFPGFEKKFNMDTLNNYLSFQYAVPPQTFFEGVYCLMPAHYLWYKDGKITTTRYWEPQFHPDNSLTEEEAVDRIEEVFENSVNAHKISDVEVGCFLSSGVDSSYVATYFPGQNTFTVGFDFGEKYNEISWARELSEKIGVNHHYKVISSEEFWGNIKKVQYHMDQPLADPSCIALYFVSKLASEHVKVVLSGEGADELFGGYPMYCQAVHFMDYEKKVPKALRKAAGGVAARLPEFKGKHFLVRGAKEPWQRYMRANYVFESPADRDQYLKKDYHSPAPETFFKPYFDKVQSLDEPTQLQWVDMHTWMLYDILLKADRMSMANSLELRVPFLDREMLELALSIPQRYRSGKEQTKIALRGAAFRQLPESVAKRKKLGFPVPLNDWLRQDKYYAMVREKFTGPVAEQFFDTAALLRLLDDHKAGRAKNMTKIWSFYSFILWYELYFVNSAAPAGVYDT